MLLFLGPRGLTAACNGRKAGAKHILQGNAPILDASASGRVAVVARSV